MKYLRSKQQNLPKKEILLVNTFMCSPMLGYYFLHADAK